MSSETEPPEVVVDDHGRPEPPLAADEAGTLMGFLDFQRATFEWKTRALTATQFRHRLEHPSTMTLAGLMKHLTFVEDYWFTVVAAGRPCPPPWDAVSDDDPEWEWVSALEDSAEDLREHWNGSVARSREVTTSLLAEDHPAALAATHAAWGGQARVSLRWIVTHMVEEYARHNGHADFLREAVDGQTGE
ncbi:MAG: DinB family protein [Propionibacteriaceae bacterium]|nr:DinB family protein [Propionibacteriaceae bacterium]